MKIANKAALGVLVLGAMGAGNASASSGTLDFEGEITNVTCNVGVNGQQPGTATIVLPTVPVSSLATTASTAGRTFIRFELLDSTCGDGVGGTTPDLVSVFFNANSSVDLTGTIGRLDNTAATNAATNVALQLVGADGTPLDLFQDASVQSQGANSVAPGQGVVLTRYVEYYAKTDGVTAGAVQSTAQYDLHYH